MRYRIKVIIDNTIITENFSLKRYAALRFTGILERLTRDYKKGSIVQLLKKEDIGYTILIQATI